MNNFCPERFAFYCLSRIQLGESRSPDFMQIIFC